MALGAALLKRITPVVRGIVWRSTGRTHVAGHAGLQGYFQGVHASDVGVTGSDVPIGGVVFTGWIENAP